jgi:hypothetical protein
MEIDEINSNKAILSILISQIKEKGILIMN